MPSPIAVFVEGCVVCAPLGPLGGGFGDSLSQAAAAAAAAAAGAYSAATGDYGPDAHRDYEPEGEAGNETTPRDQVNEALRQQRVDYRQAHPVGSAWRQTFVPVERAYVRQVQKWVDAVMGVDTVGTVPSGGKA